MPLLPNAPLEGVVRLVDAHHSPLGDHPIVRHGVEVSRRRNHIAQHLHARALVDAEEDDRLKIDGGQVLQRVDTADGAGGDWGDDNRRRRVTDERAKAPPSAPAAGAWRTPAARRAAR